MHRRTRILLSCLLLAASAAVDAAAQGGTPRAVALVHVHVVDVERGLVLRDQTVVTRGDRIVSVSPASAARVPAGAERIDGHGAFVIPGLWDMHVHLSGDPRLDDAAPGARDARATTMRYFGSLLLASGVTGVRDGSGRLEALKAMHALAQAPGSLAPRMVFTGGKLGPNAVVPGAPAPVRTREDIRRAIGMLRANGASFVKLAPWFPAALIADALAECRAHAMPCVGHFPRDDMAPALGQPAMRSFEHLHHLAEFTSTYPSARFFAMMDEREQPTFAQRVLYRMALRTRPEDPSTEAIETHDPAQAARLFARIAAAGSFVTPTLLEHDVHTRIANVHAAARDTLLMLDEPTSALRRDTRTGAQRAAHARRWAFYQASVRGLHRAGVPLLAGTDLPLLAVPGASLSAELMLLQGAGLSPIEALRTATINPARYFGGTDTLGTVQAGRVADLVLLRRNPLEDVGHVTSVNMVMTRGRLLRRTTLDSLVQVARAARTVLRRR